MKTINKLHWLLLVTLIAVACSSDPVDVPDPPKKPDEPTPEPPKTEIKEGLATSQKNQMLMKS